MENAAFLLFEPVGIRRFLLGSLNRSMLFQQEVKTLMYWAPPPAQLALSISYITYGDQLRMSVMADKNIVPNVDLLPELFTYEVPFSVPFSFSGKFFNLLFLSSAYDDDGKIMFSVCLSVHQGRR